MDIYLIRHGECYSPADEYYNTEKGIADPPLTDKGISQAEKLAVRCQTVGFDLIVSSDLSRAVQTAEKIIALTPCDFLIDTVFREIDMGEPWNEHSNIYEQWLLHNEDIPYPNGENGQDVWNRCEAKLRNLTSTQNEKIAVVCHGGTIRSIICGVLDIPQQKRFYFGSRLENCSISIIKYKEEDKRFYLHTFNDFSHLM